MLNHMWKTICQSICLVVWIGSRALGSASLGSEYYIYSRECASAKFFETQLHSAVWAIYNGLPCPYKVKLDSPIVYLSAVVCDDVFPKTSRLVG